MRFFDFDDGDYGIELSDDMLMDSEGDLMTRMSDNMALDLNTGELHFVSGLSSDDDQSLISQKRASVSSETGAFSYAKNTFIA